MRPRNRGSKIPKLIVSFLLLSQSIACSSVPDRDTTGQRIDLLIENGRVFDGTGTAEQDTDIGIAGGRIAFIGDAQSTPLIVEQRIDATGHIVAPGFIDPHTHAKDDLLSPNVERRRNLPFAYQGVSTVVVGNDGFGNTNIAQMTDHNRQRGIGTNVAYLAGFGHIRHSMLGDENRPPSDREMDRMKSVMSQAMCEGAFGLSAGLYYTPQNFATTGEVVELAKIAARHGGYYDTHLRDESTYNIGLLAAVQEALEIGQKSGAAVHIAHIKALGPAVWGQSKKVIERIEKARVAGQQVTADQYPWSASGTRISNALVPRWALDGGLQGLRERLKDSETAVTIKREMMANLDRRGGADKLLITGSLELANVAVGQTLAEVATAENRDPIDAATGILMNGDARVASFNMDKKDITAFARRDWVVTGSDGSTGHPRKYGSFPKAYRDFVVKDKLLTMTEFIRRNTGRTADIIGLNDRGYLKPGMAADIVIFDPQKFAPRATYQRPRRLSAGVVYLFVNGKALIFDGAHTAELPGKPLRKEAGC